MSPLSFGMALARLKKREISLTIFLISCVIPFAFYLNQKNPEVYSDEDETIRNVILDQEIFDAESKGIHWGVVQMYRMLAIVLINTVVLNPTFKFLWLAGIFAAYHLYDGYRMPFKHKFLNLLQSLTSACLFFLTLCSAPVAFLAIGNIAEVPSMDILIAVSQQFNLFLYMIVLLAFPLWKFWEKCNELQSRKKDKQLFNEL